MNEIKQNKGYLDMRGITKYSKYSSSSIYRAIRSGKLRYFQPGRKLLFRLLDVDAWIRSGH